MSELVKKSIFKQKTFRKVYVIHRECSITRPIVVMYIKTIDEEIMDSDQNIYTCDLEMPLLEIGDLFYIEEKNMTVKIQARIRTSSNNVCYEVEPKIIEDEKTKESYDKCVNIVGNFDSIDAEYRSLKNEYRNLKRDFDQIREHPFRFLTNKKILNK